MLLVNEPTIVPHLPPPMKRSVSEGIPSQQQQQQQQPLHHDHDDPDEKAASHLISYSASQPGGTSLYLWSPSSSTSISSASSAASSSRSSPSPPTPTVSVPDGHHDRNSDDGGVGGVGAAESPNVNWGLVFPPAPPRYRSLSSSNTVTQGSLSALRTYDLSSSPPSPTHPENPHQRSPTAHTSSPPVTEDTSRIAPHVPARHRHPSPLPPANRKSHHHLRHLSNGYRTSAALLPPLRTSVRRSWNSPAMWIGGYFLFNMGLTLYNKAILVKFPYPYTMTALHTFCGTVGCVWARRVGYYTPAHLTTRQTFTLTLFSILYTLNIALSNLSLQLVTVPFHQVVRASSPFFTILVSWLLRNSSRNDHAGEKTILGVGRMKLISLVPVIAGVGFATYGDYSFTAWGLILTLFGTFLAALKTVLTSILQTAPAASKLETPLPTATPYQSRFPKSPSPNGRFPKDSGVFPASPLLEVHHNIPGDGLYPNEKMDGERGRGSGRKSFSYAPSSPSPLATFTPAPSSPALSAVDISDDLSSSSSSLSRKARRFLRSLNPFSGSTSFIGKRFDLDFGPSLSSRNSTVVPAQGPVRTMTMIKLHPLDLLARMSPLACAQCIVYAFLSGEVTRLRASEIGAGWGTGGGFVGRQGMVALVLGMNGVIAFGLNVVSLTANQKNGPLTMTVAANVKQVLTILLAMSVFHLHIGPTNAIGIALTLFGGAWYGALEYRSKRERMRLG